MNYIRVHPLYYYNHHFFPTTTAFIIFIVKQLYRKINFTSILLINKVFQQNGLCQSGKMKIYFLVGKCNDVNKNKVLRM
jgi:hypothetical protein